MGPILKHDELSRTKTQAYVRHQGQAFKFVVSTRQGLLEKISRKFCVPEDEIQLNPGFVEGKTGLTIGWFVRIAERKHFR
jgi:hypothetical protein